MNRTEIKEQAKKIIIGNKWYIWKPFLIVTLILSAISGVWVSIVRVFDFNQTSTLLLTLLVTIPISIFEAGFIVGYCKYCLDFIHGKKVVWIESVKFAKEHFLVCFLTSILVALIIVIGSILLIVPGIIASLGLIFYTYVCAENPNLSATNILKKSWTITKNNKGKLFVLILSFLGWQILACLTLGIIYIWLFPYMMITFTLAYEKLKI